MEAVILAGGYGTRLRSISRGTPKALMSINGRPFLVLLLERLKAQGITHVVLSLHYKAELFLDLLGKADPKLPRLSFCIEKTPLGTGGGAKLASKQIESSNFFILNGDTYCPFRLDSFPKEVSTAELFVLAAWVDNVSRFGHLVFDNSASVVSFNEKGATGSGYINAGTYFVNKNSLLKYAAEAFSLERDYIDPSSLKIKAVATHEVFVDIGIPNDYYAAMDLLK